MGLTGGIVDIGGLYDCLAGVLTEKADPDFILEKYHDVRSQKWREIINPVSSQNILRLHKQDPNTALEKDEFLKMCRKTENGVYKRDIVGLTHDFTQYYHETKGNNKEFDKPTASHMENVAMAAVSVAD